jgi:hypothetical protein
MGKKSTEGYKIGIESVVETPKNVIITIKETIPEKGSINTQEITTPYCVLKINPKNEIIFK